MRLGATLFFGASFLIGVGALPAYAVPLGDQPTMPSSQGIEQVAVHCGPHSHYVPAHRGKDGHRVLGHCVRDRRH